MAKRLTEAELFALGPTVDVPTAGSAWGIGRTASYEMAKSGEFPCEVLTLRGKHIVLKSAILGALGYQTPSAPAEAAAQPAA